MPFSVRFQEPLWLALTFAVPFVWWLSRRSLAALGTRRAWTANLLRSLVLLGVVVALAEPQWNQVTDRVAVAYLLDQSESIPAEHRAAMLRYVANNVERHRRVAAGDRAAVIVFGREAAIELPPVEFTPSTPRVETLIDDTATNLADALTKAVAVLPEDSSRRVVIVSDGNENIGAAAKQSQLLLQAGIGIDVVPAPTNGKQDVSVVSVSAPNSAKKDQPLEVRVVLQNQGDDPAPVSGKLRIIRKVGGREEMILEEPVQLPVGKTVKSFREVPRESDFFVYEARFVPDQPAQDRYLANNVGSGFTDVRGQGHVLVVEDALNRGEFDQLVDSLQAEGLEADLVPSDQAFSSLADLQRYDCVILANLPRAASSDSGSLVSLSDNQIEMLVQNTKELGCGLIMLGGDRSFGAGGWIGTKLEHAMPVDFQIKNARAVPVGALALVIDRSGSMSGTKLSLSVAAAREAIKMLGARDFVTVVAFDSEPTMVVPLQRKGTGRTAIGHVSRISEGGGTDLYPGMKMAFESLQQADAAAKHMIVLTDGQTPQAAFLKLCRDMRSQHITVTGVAVGSDADRVLLAKIAAQGGGKFYAAADPRNIPRIFMAETRRVARPVIRELSPPLSPVRVGDSQLLTGIEDPLPPLRGFVQTSVKEGPLVNVLLRSPVPNTEKNSTVLATWNFGLGKTAAFTTDAGHQWAAAWRAWDDYGKFFSQLIRWSMRPTGGQAGYSIATQTKDLRTQVVVNAFGKDQEFSNFVSLYGTVVGPDLKPLSLQMEQTAPGRYSGAFDSVAPGSYFVTIATPQGPYLRAGVNIGTSREYSDFHVNLPLLQTLADGVPRGGKPGVLVTAEGQLPFATAEGTQLAEELDPFRRDLAPAVTRHNMWPVVLVFASLIFFGDVFIRRAQLDLSAFGVRISKAWSVKSATPATATLTRLSARKEEIRSRYEQKSERSSAGLSATEELAKIADERRRVEKASPVATVEPQDTMSRLLATKRQISKEKRR